MFAPIKQGSLLGYAMFTTMHRDEMKCYGTFCKTSNKKVAKFAQAMFSTKNHPKRSWIRYESYQASLRFRFRNNFGIFQCELAKTGRNQPSHHMCKTGNTKVTVHHNWSCLSGQMFLVTRKKCPKDLNENLDLPEKMLGTKSILP